MTDVQAMGIKSESNAHIGENYLLVSSFISANHQTHSIPITYPTVTDCIAVKKIVLTCVTNSFKLPLKF